MRLFFFFPKEILQRIQPIYFFLQVSLYIRIMLNRSTMATFHLLISISRLHNCSKHFICHYLFLFRMFDFTITKPCHKNNYVMTVIKKGSDYRAAAETLR